MEAKPPLNEDLLIHFGVKGMKWGQRKKRPDEKKRKDTFSPAAINARLERQRKIRNGAIIVTGTLAIGLLLSKSGRTAVTNSAVTQYAQQRTARQQAVNNPFGKLVRDMRKVKAASIPSPNEMIADARMAGVRNAFNREGAQRLTDRAWRDQARLTSMNREMQGGRAATDAVFQRIRDRL